MAVVPFTLDGGHILFDAEFDGIRGTYVFDTGAPATVLSARYLQPGKTVGDFASLDTVSAATRASGVEDGRAREEQRALIVLHQVKIGALVQSLAPTDVGPPRPWIASNAVLMADSRFDQFTRPVFGSFGLSAMESFQIVIDYPQHQLIFIRLDSAGHPLASVPHHTLAGSVPLVPVAPEHTWWGIRVALGRAADTEQEAILLDTGGQFNFLPDATMRRLATHLSESTETLPSGATVPRYVLDHLTLGTKTVDSVEIRPLQQTLLGYPFLSQLGVVGFNFRAHQFFWYH
jgi:hypothetical protein